MSLFKARHEAAERTFQDYDFEGYEIAATSGWLSEGDIFSRKIFIEAENPEELTEVASLQVIFDPDSSSIRDMSCLLVSNGAEIGFAPGVLRAPIKRSMTA